LDVVFGASPRALNSKIADYIVRGCSIAYCSGDIPLNTPQRYPILTSDAIDALGKFQTRNRDPREAFEALCNQLFERWCMREYRDTVHQIHIVNGAEGDGGVEAYAISESTYREGFLTPLAFRNP
jgi:hypothetical protein